jgi:hypothetical protein
MSEVIRIKWYATILRGDQFADAVAELAPIALRHGATRYAVHRSLDDRYSIDQMIWFDDHGDWYRFWESPELVEFRARHAGKFQVPITYTAYEEIAAGELGPQVPLGEDTAPAGSLSPSTV